MISVIIPVYNVEQYLDFCIQSIVNQRYANLQIILINDGSTDSSGSKCEEWAKRDLRIQVIHKKNGGLSSARNAGLKVAKGNYIAFVDSDDFIEQNMFYEMRWYANKTKAQIISCGILQFIDGNLEQSTPFMHLTREISLNTNDYLKLVLRHEIDNAVCNKLYQASLLRHGSFFKEGVINEDIIFNIDKLKSYPLIYYIPKCYYNYRVRKGSITQQANPRLYDFIENAFEVKRIVLEELNLPLTNETDAFIYHEITNYISVLEKYNATSENKYHYQFCKRYVYRKVSNFLNTDWSIACKLRFLLVTLTPSFFRFLFKLRHR